MNKKAIIISITIMMLIVAVPALFPSYFGMHRTYYIPAWILIANTIIPFLFGLIIGIKVGMFSAYKRKFAELSEEEMEKYANTS